MSYCIKYILEENIWINHFKHTLNEVNHEYFIDHLKKNWSQFLNVKIIYKNLIHSFNTDLSSILLKLLHLKIESNPSSSGQ